MTWLLYIPLAILSVVLLAAAVWFACDGPFYPWAQSVVEACFVAGCVFLFIAGRWSV